MSSRRPLWNEPVLPIADLLARERRRQRQGRWIWGSLVALCIVTAISLHAWLADPPVWCVRPLEIAGNRAVETQEIADALELRAGMPWWSAMPRLGVERPESLPRVAHARIEFAFPLGLRVEVAEREAVLRVIGEELLVAAADGVLLRPDPILDPADLPCLSGHSSVMRPGERVQVADGPWTELMRVASSMPELWANISQIDCHDPHAVAVYLRGERHVLVWDPDRNDHLWEQVPHVLAQLRENGLAGDAVLDMRFRERIVVRVPEELLEPVDAPQEGEPAHDDLGAIPHRPGGDQA